MYLSYRSQELDLFDLAPFTSDIDLEHDGPSDKTLLLLEAIQAEVPFSSWFRWSINDAEKARKADAARRRSTHVPLRQLRFSTHDAATIPDAALCDLERREVSLDRNPAFYNASSSQQRRDLEVYGMMMALNVEAEMRDIAGDASPALRSRAMRWLLRGGDELAAAGNDFRLAARFWALFAVQLARNESDDPVTARLFELARQYGIFNLLNIDSENLAAPGHAFSVSKTVPPGHFRIPELSPKIVTGRAAQALIREFGIEAGRDDRSLLVDPAFDVVAMLPDITIKPYFGPDFKQDDHDVFQSGMEQEFVEIAWRRADGPPLDAHRLTAQFVPLSSHVPDTACTLPAVGGMFGADRPWVRARIDDLVDRSPGGRDGSTALLILQARDA
jgi:hypothetical protein